PSRSRPAAMAPDVHRMTSCPWRWSSAHWRARSTMWAWSSRVVPPVRTLVPTLTTMRAMSFVRHAAFRSGADGADVLGEHAALGFVGRHLPGRAAARQLVVAQGHLDAARAAVDRHHVAVLDERDGAALLRLGADVADDEAVRSAAEASVGDERHVVAEPGAHDGRRRREHLG